MFMTNPNQYPANAAASIASLKLAVDSVPTAKEEPKEAQHRVLHDLWLDQINAKIEKQESKWKEANRLHEALRDFSPPHAELTITNLRNRS
jgi:hypothetical protein